MLQSPNPNLEHAVTTSPITVRPAILEDASAIVRFQQNMALETEDKPLDAPTVTAGVAAVFDDTLKGFYVVAETDGAVVGSLLITYEWSDWRNATFWWIQSVYVDAAHRRLGVYTAMHRYVLERARADGCGVRLYVERTNTRAQATYKALGMDHSHYDLYEIDFTETPL